VELGLLEAVAGALDIVGDEWAVGVELPHAPRTRSAMTIAPRANTRQQ